ncbi:hypothetical protein FJTKL_00878 [Diaporthe vaccinii]|uniref:Uncharacterized protein n=1 Tax=Diaporthe vaccinii TaxID=105482 RepID=A0ABR4E1Y2_9PEZI
MRLRLHRCRPKAVANTNHQPLLVRPCLSILDQSQGAVIRASRTGRTVLAARFLTRRRLPDPDPDPFRVGGGSSAGWAGTQGQGQGVQIQGSTEIDWSYPTILVLYVQ